MRRSHFSPAEITAALRDLEAGVRVPEVCARIGVSEITLAKWRRKAGLLAPFSDPVAPVALSTAQAVTRAEGLERRLEAFRLVLVTLLEPEDLERAARLLEVSLAVSPRRARRLLGLPPINAAALPPGHPLMGHAEVLDAVR